MFLEIEMIWIKISCSISAHAPPLLLIAVVKVPFGKTLGSQLLKEPICNPDVNACDCTVYACWPFVRKNTRV